MDILSIKAPLFNPENFDWDKLDQTYDWIKEMKGCVQDPVYHAEGDVWIHTKMVVEALLKLPVWSQLSAEKKAVLYAACLLHDVSKPECTTIEYDGRISSKGHAQRGEKYTREILMAFPLTFAVREQICKLVRHHGLPLWFFEKPDPAKAIIKASLTCDMQLLAWVAEADVRGRICADQALLLEKVELFRLYCQELGCWEKPKSFASDHTRFLYFYKEDAVYPDAEIFDDTQGEVYLMCGIPGAGKDTWIRKNLPNLSVISLDAIRKELKIDFKDEQGKVIQTALERAKGFLRKKENFVWNATNITRQVRQKLIDLAATYRAKITIVYLDVNLDLALQQNREREMMIKESVIANFFRRLEIPDLSECHHLIVVER